MRFPDLTEPPISQIYSDQAELRGFWSTSIFLIGSLVQFSSHLTLTNRWGCDTRGRRFPSAQVNLFSARFVTCVSQVSSLFPIAGKGLQFNLLSKEPPNETSTFAVYIANLVRNRFACC